MILLSANNIKKSYGIVNVLKNINLTINDNEKIGIVGNNGAGKSTLFNIFVDKTSSDEGQIFKSKNLNIGYLHQSNSIKNDVTLYNYCLEVFEDLILLENTMRSLEINLSKNPHDKNLIDEYSTISDKFNTLNGYSYPSRTRGVLTGLGFSESDFSRKISTLSGGQKTRLDLAKLLLIQYDLLLLDEPTNHLDIESVMWLENYLLNYQGSIVIISHDRYFLDKIINKIYEIENQEGKLYTGSYSDYINQKRINYELELTQYYKNQNFIKKEQQLIRKYKNLGTEKLAKRARDREHKLDRVDVLQKPFWLNKNINLNFNIKIKSGDHVLSCKNLTKYYDSEKIFENISFDVYKQNKIGFIGKNGIGKSTLFKIITGCIHEYDGEYTIGHNVTIGHYDQDLENINSDNTLLEEIHSLLPKFNEEQIRTYLGSFLFTGDDVFKKIEALSGGEKSRISLLKLMLSNRNFLLLDEPTNHLDIISRETLENALLNFDGTLFTISHDRYFLNKVCNKIYEINDDGVTEYLGNYDYYSYKKESLRRFAQDSIKKDIVGKTQRKELLRAEKNLLKTSKKNKQIIIELENSIHKLESRIEEIHILQCLEENYSNSNLMKSLNDEILSLNSDLKKLYLKWEKLI